MIAFAMASCTKDYPSKSEVEASFDKITATLPTLSVDASNVVYDYLSSTATVKVTISGLTDLDSLSVGLLSSKDETMTNTKFSAIQNPADGTVEVSAQITGETTWYLKAAAASTIGTAYSETVKIDVPAFPFWANIGGLYKGTVTSVAYGDEYDSVLRVVLDSEDPENKCYILGFEPYYASKGYPNTQNQFNFLECTIDNENKCIIAPYGSDMNLGGRWMHSFTADGACHGIFTFSKDYSSMIRAWEFYTVKPNGSAEDYYSTSTYKRQ